jgi:signal transduction histidine kinase
MQTKRGVKLVVKMPGSVPYVLGDTGRIIQIFHNLIGNACKFTHTGQICIGATRRGDDVSEGCVHAYRSEFVLKRLAGVMI